MASIFLSCAISKYCINTCPMKMPNLQSWTVCKLIFCSDTTLLEYMRKRKCHLAAYTLRFYCAVWMLTKCSPLRRLSTHHLTASPLPLDPAEILTWMLHSYLMRDGIVEPPNSPGKRQVPLTNSITFKKWMVVKPNNQSIYIPGRLPATTNRQDGRRHVIPGNMQNTGFEQCLPSDFHCWSWGTTCRFLCL